MLFNPPLAQLPLATTQHLTVALWVIIQSGEGVLEEHRKNKNETYKECAEIQIQII